MLIYLSYFIYSILYFLVYFIACLIQQLCLSEEYLNRYKNMISKEGVQVQKSSNFLRDTHDYYDEKGHVFSYNTIILYSYDVCGNCEAHALLLALKLGLATSIETAPTLIMLDKKIVLGDINLRKGPINDN